MRFCESKFMSKTPLYVCRTAHASTCRVRRRAWERATSPPPTSYIQPEGVMDLVGSSSSLEANGGQLPVTRAYVANHFS